MKSTLTTRRFLFASALFFLSLAVQAQYWFGPKIGGQRTDFIYQEEEYKTDTFNIDPHYGFQVGGVFIYQATEKYAVHAELNYERIVKEVTNKFNPDIPVFSKQRYNYLTIPFSLRWNFGSEPTHFYISGGPKLSLWLGGTGELYLDELNESVELDGPIEYRYFFNPDKGGEQDRRTIREANRLQYALQVGAGVYFDVVTGGRLLLDFRYVFGHSNMGFNNNPDFTFETYQEIYEYRNNMLSISLAYLFEFDAREAVKGKSTIKESNKKKIKRVKKN